MSETALLLTKHRGDSGDKPAYDTNIDEYVSKLVYGPRHRDLNGFEVLTAVAVNSSSHRDSRTSSTVNAKRRFRGSYLLYFQG